MRIKRGEHPAKHLSDRLFLSPRVFFGNALCVCLALVGVLDCEVFAATANDAMCVMFINYAVVRSPECVCVLSQRIL